MKKAKVLIVDDKEDNLYLLRSLLQGNGYEVEAARHGADALSIARKNPPDVIISDILMPVMDGFALCREWKKDALLKPIPFIFYTATYTDVRDKEFALGLGAARFIIKPEEPDVIMAAIRETIQQTGHSHTAHVEPTAKASSLSPSEVPEKEESVFLKQYNEALMRKLEAKLEQLERANHLLAMEIAAQKESEERFRSFVENANDIVYSLTLDGIITYVSPNWTERLGHDVREIIGLPFDRIVHPDDVPACRALMEKTIMTGNKQPEIEYRARHKNGTWMWHVSNGSLIRDHDGKITAFMGIAHDITLRKQAELQVQEQMNELSRWNRAMLDRESRNLELKREVNGLLEKTGQPAKYESVRSNEESKT